MNIKQKILKAALLLRRWGNKTLTLDEEIAELAEWYTADNEADLDAWIDMLKADLAKTPEQRKAEEQTFLEELMKAEAAEAEQDARYFRRDRDEWDDLWADRARSCGATWYR